MTRTTVFGFNRSQAVRLPKDVAFPEGMKDVSMLRDGKRRIIVPADSVWDDVFDALGVDLGARDQPPTQARDCFNSEADALCMSTVVLTERLHGAAKSARPAHNWTPPSTVTLAR